MDAGGNATPQKAAERKFLSETGSHKLHGAT